MGIIWKHNSKWKKEKAVPGKVTEVEKYTFPSSLEKI